MSPLGPRDAAVFEVREALGQEGCVVCRLSLRSVTRLMKSIAYEQVNDIELRDKLRRAAGFCNTHAHQWLTDSQSVLGTALIYRDVLQAALRQLETPEAARPSRLRKLLATPAPPARCPACDAQQDAEAHYISALLVVAQSEPGRLELADAVCRRHALGVLRAGGDGSVRIIERTTQLIEELIADLDEVIRKEDYRFRHEARTDAERTAPARAITWAAGQDGLVGN